MASSLNGTGITFSDGSTTSSNSSYLAIGSVVCAFYTTSTILAINSLVAGSTLRVASDNMNNMAKIIDYPTGPSVSLGASGTWRSLYPADASGFGSTYRAPILFVRVS